MKIQTSLFKHRLLPSNIFIYCFLAIGLVLFTGIPAYSQLGTVLSETKISSTHGGFSGSLSNNARLGRGIANLGDIDGDGVVDIAVGAQNENAVYIMFLNPDGSVKTHQKISSNNGGFTGNLHAQDIFGSGVCALGDLTGNGVTEIAVGAGQDGTGGADKGAIWILFLDSNGIVNSHQKIAENQGGFTGTLNTKDYFGKFVDAVDLNNNGIPEIIASAYMDNDGGTDRGAVYILFLDSLGTVQSHQKISSTQGGFTGPLNNGDNFGYKVAAIGDVDGDGVPDIAVGARNHEGTGALWILFMNPDGTVKAEQKISETAGNFTGNLSQGGRFGSPKALGDLSNNGVPDILVGAENDNDGGSDRGSVWILFLTDSGTVMTHQKISSTQGGLQGPLSNDDRFGSGLEYLGDINNNGLVEIAVGARGDNDGGANRGAVWILSLLSRGEPGSSIKKLNEKSFSANIFPNPTKDILHIEINKPLNNFKLDITDMNGKLITSQKIEQYDNNNVLKIPVKKLASGAYFVTIKHHEQIISKKFIKH